MASRPAMRGDLTSGPVGRTLVMFSIPMLLSNILQSLSGTINSIWVGRLIGEDALAATANANIIMFLVAGAAFGFGMAGTVKIGQRFGARDIDGARRTFGTAVGFSSVLMVGIAALGWLGAPALLTALDTPGHAYELALLPERLVHWAAEPRAFFKFVIAEAGDVEEVLALQTRFAIPAERLYLMAEGTDAATLAARESWLAPLCLAHNLTLSKRLHIELYGDTRGT